MKLEEITQNVYYVPGAVNIGVLEVGANDANGANAVLIDTGLDREAGRRILKLLEKNQLKVKAIVNTHSHADHFGGNSFIVKRSQAKVFAPEIEAGIIQYPYIEPLYLFSAHPVRDLQNRFLMAEASRVDFILKEFDHGLKPLNLDLDLEIIPLYGHSPKQIGVAVDDILFCADSVFSKEVIEKYKIPLFMDIEKQKQTLSFLEKSDYDFYIPCHAKPTSDISELVELNLGVIERVEEFLAAERGTTDEILRRLCKEFGIRLADFTSYSLMLSTLKAYLGHLYDRGVLEVEFGDTLYWKGAK
ncbi:MAG: MBL fold metallo-hydrolase [Archaeoglobus sp.]|nr:MBL fold metallo-hydrolase [Archaeoglobus sp.]